MKAGWYSAHRYLCTCNCAQNTFCIHQSAWFHSQTTVNLHVHSINIERLINKSIIQVPFPFLSISGCLIFYLTVQLVLCHCLRVARSNNHILLYNRLHSMLMSIQSKMLIVPSHPPFINVLKGSWKVCELHSGEYLCQHMLIKEV